MLELLEKEPRCRNDDLWLVLQVWQKKQQIKLFIPYDEIQYMINPETIRRVRQEIQNDEGLFLPTDPQVLIRRRVREDLIRKYYAGHAVLKEWENKRFEVK